VDFLGSNPVYLGAVLLTLLAAPVTLAAAWMSYRRWRALQARTDGVEEEDPEFMLFVGLWLNGFFTFIILLSAVPLLLHSGCTWI
jgi:hypothetical protein